jgi:hypothetical protein
MYSVVKCGGFVLINVDKKIAIDYIKEHGGKLYYKDLERQKINGAGWWFEKED